MELFGAGGIRIGVYIYFFIEYRIVLPVSQYADVESSSKLVPHHHTSS